VKLGGTLSENTSIAASTFYLDVNKSGSSLNTNAFPFYSNVTSTATGTETNQYVIAGNYAVASFANTATFTPNAAAKHGGTSSTVFKTAAGNYAGIMAANFGAIEVADAGDITTAANFNALPVRQLSGSGALFRV